MAETPTPSPADTEQYDIRVVGHLAHRWAAFFDGMTLTAQDDGSTVIRGPVTDQAALHGLLRKVSDLGLPLLSVAATAAPAVPSYIDTSPPADRPVAGPTPARSTT